MQCYNCNKEVKSFHNICPYCGECYFVPVCSQCGHTLDNGKDTCEHCCAGVDSIQIMSIEVADMLKGALQGNPTEQIRLSKCYENGIGVEQDDEAACKWCRMAAEQGDSYAQLVLGRRYMRGKGVSQSDEKAVEWYRKAAEQGERVAQHNLGVCYYDGTGVGKSCEKAFTHGQAAIVWCIIRCMSFPTL